MTESSINLASLFKIATQNLVQNKEQLNQADTYNGDHGDNMVKVFQVITQAMQEKKNADPADQLAYASELLRQKANSGSAREYSNTLQEAAQQFQGQSINSSNAMDFIQTLLGGSVANQTPAQPTPQQGGDLVGSLLGGLLGGTNTAPPADNSGIDAGDILSAGLNFLQAKQQGKSNVEALVNAMVTSSRIGQTDYRAQSGSIVANSLLQAFSSMAAKK